MNWFVNLLTNPFFITPVVAWLISQVIKTILYAIEHKKIVWSRLIGDGGIPSCHSATVASLAFICTLVYGTHSFQCAISLILAIIVCHDAMGVRQEAGKHAIVLNRLLRGEQKEHLKALGQEQLSEHVGHTPVQVFAGVGVGIGVALAMYFLFFQSVV